MDVDGKYFVLFCYVVNESVNTRNIWAIAQSFTVQILTLAYFLFGVHHSVLCKFFRAHSFQHVFKATAAESVFYRDELAFCQTPVERPQ